MHCEPDICVLLHRSDARYSTSAAIAETEASDTTLSTKVQQNASQLHTAAVDAAHSAEVSLVV